MQSTVGSNEKDMNATEQDTYINLTVKLHGYGSTLFYRINRSSQFKKLMTDYSDRYSRELELVIFLFGRGHIEEEQTPNELHMKDGDIIDTTFRYGANINLKIKGQDGYEASFEMHYNSRLEKLMDFYCRKYCLEVTEVAFLFNGRLLRADQTPWKLHMRYEVEIYAVFYDQIAHIELKPKSQMATIVDNSDSELWSDLETQTFIYILVRKVKNGNMSIDDEWDNMTSELNSITNRTYKKEQLKEKMHRLQAMYHEFNSLLQNPEFKWNAETNTFSASAEVWQNYLQAHDKTAHFQKKGCDYCYKWLEMIFSKDNENGGFHYSDDDIRVERITHSGKRKVQVKDHKYRKGSAPRQKGDAHPTSTEPSMTRAKSNKGESSEAASSYVTLDYSITKCVAALEKIEDISNDIYMKALEKFQDPNWREMFIAIFSNNRKQGWLSSL
ncbi:hypothetical protein P8452_25382 [Trifolium repens]|nr:hypothetical protein P8452_25382 [Trifolium repens]